MADDPRKGVIIATSQGNLKHEDADSWNVGLEGDLYVFAGSDTIATYHREFWNGAAYEGVTKPA